LRHQKIPIATITNTILSANPIRNTVFGTAWAASDSIPFSKYTFNGSYQKRTASRLPVKVPVPVMPDGVCVKVKEKLVPGQNNASHTSHPKSSTRYIILSQNKALHAMPISPHLSLITFLSFIVP